MANNNNEKLLHMYFNSEIGSLFTHEQWKELVYNFKGEEDEFLLLNLISYNRDKEFFISTLQRFHEYFGIESLLDYIENDLHIVAKIGFFPELCDFYIRNGNQTEFFDYILRSSSDNFLPVIIEHYFYNNNHFCNHHPNLDYNLVQSLLPNVIKKDIIHVNLYFKDVTWLDHMKFLGVKPNNIEALKQDLDWMNLQISSAYDFVYNNDYIKISHANNFYEAVAVQGYDHNGAYTKTPFLHTFAENGININLFSYLHKPVNLKIINESFALDNQHNSNLKLALIRTHGDQHEKTHISVLGDSDDLLTEIQKFNEGQISASELPIAATKNIINLFKNLPMSVLVESCQAEPLLDELEVNKDVFSNKIVSVFYDQSTGENSCNQAMTLANFLKTNADTDKIINDPYIFIYSHLLNNPQIKDNLLSTKIFVNGEVEDLYSIYNSVIKTWKKFSSETELKALELKLNNLSYDLCINYHDDWSKLREDSSYYNINNICNKETNRAEMKILECLTVEDTFNCINDNSSIARALALTYKYYKEESNFDEQPIYANSTVAIDELQPVCPTDSFAAL